MQFIFAYNYHDNKDIDCKRPVPEFIWNELKGLFFALHQTIFSLESFDSNYFFSCLHALHAYVYILRGQEKKNLVLMRRLT